MLLVAVAFSLALSAPTHYLARSLLGKHCLIISTAAASEPDRVLPLADSVLSGGASVTLLVPLPRSGAAAADDGARALLLRIQRTGFPKLMAALGFWWGVPGQYGSGNRQRVGFQHVRADDTETLTLAFADADLLLLHTPESSDGLSSGGGESAPLWPRGERRARFAMHRATYSFVLRRLRRFGRPLLRDKEGDVEGVRWAWLGE